MPETMAVAPTTPTSTRVLAGTARDTTALRRPAAQDGPWDSGPGDGGSTGATADGTTDKKVL
jgi:hypothetical protein